MWCKEETICREEELKEDVFPQQYNSLAMWCKEHTADWTPLQWRGGVGRGIGRMCFPNNMIPWQWKIELPCREEELGGCVRIPEGRPHCKRRKSSSCQIKLKLTALFHGLTWPHFTKISFLLLSNLSQLLLLSNSVLVKSNCSSFLFIFDLADITFHRPISDSAILSNTLCCLW